MLKPIDISISSGRAPTYILGDMQFNHSSADGGILPNMGPAENSVETVYSTPDWPTEEKRVNPDNPDYSKPVTFSSEHGRQQDSGSYSYPYQHPMYPQQGIKGAEGTEKGYKKL